MRLAELIIWPVKAGRFTLLPGLLLAGVIIWLVYEMQISQLRKQFDYSVDNSFQRIVQNLTSTDAALTALIGLNQASDQMDPALFTPFSEKILQKYPLIKTIQYLTYLEPHEKEFFIREMRLLGFSQFSIYPMDKTDRQLDPDFYLVTSFIEPLTPLNAKFMGLDWAGSEPVRAELNTAVMQDSMALLQAPDFLKSPEHYLLLKPTYFGRNVAQTAEQRLIQLSGAFLIQLDWNRLTEQHNLNGSQIPFQLTLAKSIPAVDTDMFKADTAGSRFYKTREVEIGGSLFTLSAYYSFALKPLDYLKMVVIWLFCVILYLLAVSVWRKRHHESMEKQQVQLQLFKEREQAAVTLQSISDAVISIRVDQCVSYMNPIAEKMLGCELSQVLGKSVMELVHLQDLSTGRIVSNPVDYYLDLNSIPRSPANNHMVLNVHGSIISVDGNASLMKDKQGHVIGAVLVLRDVSLERQLTHELLYQASHDALTGLVNRQEFEKQLREVLEFSREHGDEYALCYLDMDQFKLVNDTCGHSAGDELLKQVSGLLLVQMREKDLVARLGGDEFGVLIFSCDLQKAKEIAERIRQSLNDFHFKWEDRVFDVSASIGLVMINRLSGNLSDILSSVDLACYAAKDAGRNMVHTYHAEDVDIAMKYSQMQWLPRIKNALVNDEFALAVQRIASIRPSQSPCTIYEFLLRWPQPDGSFISPELIIPSAERYDLMRELDRWIIDHALHAIPLLQKQLEHEHNQMYTINLSGQSIGDAELTGFILRMLTSSGVDAKLLCFEITETVAISNFSIATDFIHQLRDKGCRFALDDFGSGLSSFGYLKRLPLDFLKIDGMFVRDMLKDPIDLAMVRTIHDVAQVLNLKTIAEWVEDEDVYLALEKIGVDYAQGYYLEKPRLISDIIA